MNIELKYKLYLIDPKQFPLSEWTLCERLLGKFGKIEEYETCYIDGKFQYKYISNNRKFWLSTQI
jgi:hypothetical protein